MSMLKDLLAKFDALNEGQDATQRSVPQLPAEFKPRDISPVLGAPEKKHPTAGYFVGGESQGDVKEYMPMPEPITDDTVMELSPDTLARYRAAAKADKAFNQRGIDTALSRAARDQAPGRAEWEDEAEFLKSVNAKRDRGLKRAGDTSDFQEGLEDEPPPEKGSLEYRALKRMKGPTQEDALEALVIEIGLDRFKRENKLYREYVPALVHHYKKQGMAEGSFYNPMDDERRQQAAMDQERKDFKRREMGHELRNEPANNYQVSIDGRRWKVFADRAHAQAVARKLQAKGKKVDIHVTGAPVSESATTEDLVSKGGKNLGDYLQDVAKIIKKDPALLDRVARELDKLGPAVKTLHTDDGHEIKIHGNEDDGFRISIKNKAAKGRFRDLDEARMAVELFVARRRKHSADHSDYVEEK